MTIENVSKVKVNRADAPMDSTFEGLEDGSLLCVFVGPGVVILVLDPDGAEMSVPIEDGETVTIHIVGSTATVSVA